MKHDLANCINAEQNNTGISDTDTCPLAVEHQRDCLDAASDMAGRAARSHNARAHAEDLFFAVARVNFKSNMSLWS